MNVSRRLFSIAALPLALGGCFLMPGAVPPGGAAPQGGTGAPGGTDPSSMGSSPGSTPSSPGATTGSTSGGSSSPSQPQKPQPVSLSIDMKNECSNTVHLFIGEKPGFSSGRSTTIGGNTLSSEGRDFDGSLMIWVTDDHEKGLSSVKVSPSQRKAIIGSDCKSIHAE